MPTFHMLVLFDGRAKASVFRLLTAQIQVLTDVGAQWVITKCAGAGTHQMMWCQQTSSMTRAPPL